jgi:hypothetical protein
MKNLVYFLSYIDKSSWPIGPWLLEPDKVLWIDENTGYECLIKRIEELTHLCSYVGITKDHPLYNCSLFQFKTDSVLKDYFNTIHGGITMTYPGKEFDDEPGPNNQIGRKFIKDMQNPNDIFWIGIDFIHKDDVIPKVSQSSVENNGERIYKDIEYVKSETEKLAKLLFDFKKDYDNGGVNFQRLDYPLW